VSACLRLLRASRALRACVRVRACMCVRAWVRACVLCCGVVAVVLLMMLFVLLAVYWWGEVWSWYRVAMLWCYGACACSCVRTRVCVVLYEAVLDDALGVRVCVRV
jgi:hypothetical protein